MKTGSDCTIVRCNIGRVGVALAGLTLAGWTSLASGQTLRVPEDFASIQSAIDAAPAGATVSVGAGTYGPINFRGKALTVTARTGPGTTVISAGNMPRYAVTFAQGEGRASVLEGFTITGGRGSMTGQPNGGGVRIVASSPTLRNLVVRGNQSIRGAGVLIQGGAPMLSGLTVRENRAQFGGGVLAENANAKVSRTTIERNEALSDGGGLSVSGGSIMLHDSAVRDNSAQGVGVGAFFGHATVDLLRVTLEANGTRPVTGGDPTTSPFGGGGLYTFGQVAGVMNSLIVRNNNASAGAGVYLAGEATGLTVANLLATGNTGTLGNGVYLNGPGATIVHATIANNPGGLGVFAANAASATLVNSVVSGHGMPADGWDLAGGSTARITVRTSAVGGRVLSGAVRLGTGVAQNAGLPVDAASFIPLSGGPAVDTGDVSALPAFLKKDLLGNPRVSGSGVDLGAIELIQARRLTLRAAQARPASIAD